MPSGIDINVIKVATTELKKVAASKNKHRMPALSKKNVGDFVQHVETWDSPHKEPALEFMDGLSPKTTYELLHSMRRWYSGQTMAKKLVEHRDALRPIMRLEPDDAVGVYRGFKVPNANPLADVKPGQRIELPVDRNRGISSWTTSEAPAHKFSGGGKGKTGLVVRLVDTGGTTPLLAPPTRTKSWFNAFYEHVIGTSFRPKEEEYVISAPSVSVEVVRVKKR